jgi:general nucleoside transport system permease protein
MSEDPGRQESANPIMDSRTRDTLHPPAEPPQGTSAEIRRAVLGMNLLVSFLSVVLALVIGGILIVISSPEVISSAYYFFDRPADTFAAIWQTLTSAYSALFQGAVLNVGALGEGDLVRAFYPLSETITIAAPLIVAGLAVAIPFRAGLFNIGAQGQMTFAAIGGGYVGFALALPAGLHLLASVAVAMAFGAFWAGIAGFLKARTGAHEVITTIMLNYIALYLLSWVLNQDWFQREGRNDPISPILADTAVFPSPFGGLRIHAGFLMALLAVVVMWWVLNRTTLGFRINTVGANASAARTAGMNVGRTWIIAMLIAGAMAGLAVTMNVNGTDKVVTAGIVGAIGFDAITVALLGRASPFGVLWAGLLFGALRAGGLTMQAQTGTPIDIVLVLQALIVLFIAAPALVRSVFRIRGGSAEAMSLAKGWNG